MRPNLDKVTENSASLEGTESDYQLVLRIRKNDIHAFEVIMRRYNQQLYRIARSIVKDESESMDVVQEAYIKAYYQIHQFKGPKGFSAWLSRITVNEAMMKVRQPERVSYVGDDLDNAMLNIHSHEPGPMENLANTQLRSLIEESIDKLPLHYRKVYVMRAVQQLSTVETAEVLEVSEEVIKTRYLRAKHMLRKRFETHLENAQLNVFEFAGHRCDAIVNSVLNRLH